MNSDEIRDAAILASEEWVREVGVLGFESMTLAQAYRDGYKESAGFEAAQERKYRQSDAETKLARVRALHSRFSYFELEDSCPDTSEKHREEHHHESSDVGEFYCDQLFISAHCDYCRDDEGERRDWPCETITTLDGDPNEKP